MVRIPGRATAPPVISDTCVERPQARIRTNEVRSSGGARVGKPSNRRKLVKSSSVSTRRTSDRSCQVARSNSRSSASFGPPGSPLANAECRQQTGTVLSTRSAPQSHPVTRRWVVGLAHPNEAPALFDTLSGAVQWRDNFPYRFKQWADRSDNTQKRLHRRLPVFARQGPTPLIGLLNLPNSCPF
jgi:hypothetical protein